MILNDAELEILLAAIEGEPNEATASRLGVHVNSISRRRARIIRKLGAGSIAGAVAAAYHCGILRAPARTRPA